MGWGQWGERAYAVSGKRLPLNDNLVALRRGTVEAGQHEVEVGGQGIHDGDLALRSRAHDGHVLRRAVLGHVLPAGERRVVERRKVSVNADGRPRVEVRLQVAADGLGLRAEGVADKVDGWLVVVWGGGVWGPSVRGLFTLGDGGVWYLLKRA